MTARLLAAALLLLGIVCLAQAQLTTSNVGGGFGAAPAGITLVNNTADCPGGCATGMTSATVTLTGTVAGHLLVVGVGYCQGGCSSTGTAAVTSVTANETCVQVPSAASVGAHNTLSDIWYCKNAAGGNDAVTVNFSAPGADFPIIFLTEWSGASTTAPLDNIGTSFAGGGFATVTLTTTANTASAGELLYSPVESLGAATAGQTLINNFGSGNRDQYQISGAIGSYSNTWAIAGSANAAASLGVFKQ